MRIEIKSEPIVLPVPHKTVQELAYDLGDDLMSFQIQYNVRTNKLNSIVFECKDNAPKEKVDAVTNAIARILKDHDNFKIV